MNFSLPLHPNQKELVMNSFRTYFFLLLTLFLLACGKDRTYEYEEKTQHNHWIREQMLDQYLWADSLVDFEPAWKDFFSDPAAFLATLSKKSRADDYWSYVEVDTIVADAHARGYFNHLNSYGIDFILMKDPTGQTTRQMLRVATVYPGSPAERAGLLRGDYICSYDGYKFTSSNIKRMQTGGARTLEVRHMAVDEEEGFYYWEDTVTVKMGASEYVEDVAFPTSSVLLADGRKVGYLMCTRLVEWPVEQKQRGSSPVYRDALSGIMQQMKQVGVDEMVLDLRLCNFGTMEMAQQLASSVVSPDALHSTFVQTFWNERYTSNNQSIPYDTSVPNLGLSRVYVLIGNYTQGAAEWLIHALQHSMGEENVITIGSLTAGQNVMTQQVGYDYFVHLCPVVAYVADGDGNYDYDQIEPMIEVPEFSYLNLGEYGTEEEVLLYTALQHILGLIVPDVDEEEEE